MMLKQSQTQIPFEAFTKFERVPNASPLLTCGPGEWAAAAHAIVVGNRVHYVWSVKNRDLTWNLMHSSAPVDDPGNVEHDPRNPIMVPTKNGSFDDHTIEYPFPFLNPFDGKYYMYYLGKRKRIPKQTGLMVMGDDFGIWKRVTNEPVISTEFDYEEEGASHPSCTVEEGTIHIIYTGEAKGTGDPNRPYNEPTICHATAPVSNPTEVTKNAANPIFKGSGSAWDEHGVREAEIFKGPEYFHVFYGGYNGEIWQIGHVRTKDFKAFEANPHNPIFTPSTNPDAWDSSQLLTPQVFELNDRFYMLYAGLRGSGWNRQSQCYSGLAIARGSNTN